MMESSVQNQVSETRMAFWGSEGDGLGVLSSLQGPFIIAVEAASCRGSEKATVRQTWTWVPTFPFTGCGAAHM